jgi:phosphonate transport system substrate-binding protein
MINTTRVRIVTVTAALAVALSLTACGARDNSSGGVSPAGGEQTSAAAGSTAGNPGTAASGTTGSSTAAAGGACTGKSGDRVPDKLVLALVPSGDAKKLVESVKPLTSALTKSLGIPVSGVVTQDYQAAVEAIGANKADIGMLPSLQMSQACERYGAIPALQTLRNGKSSYAAQFFTNNPDKYCADTPKPDKNGMLYCNGTASGNGPAGLDSLAKVKGAKFCFLQAASPAGYIFPAAALKAAGIDPATGVSPITVTSNDASVLAVYNGDAEVGASYWDARTVVAKDTPDVGKKVVVFALTDEIPNDGVSLNGTLTKSWQDKISKAMMDYAATPDGVQTLEDIYQISGLQPADPAKLQRTQDVANTLGLG